MAKKLIEVALPLEAINKEASREKSIRHGHPSTLHLWWARRPLAAARAVIWASLVDDPSEHPELFPSEEAQARERERLFKILSDLIIWENSNNEEVLNAAREEILKYTDGNPPALLDPFAGGGAIPLEAQRLGLEVHAHDLNPVAVLINKAMIEIPSRFANMSPVNPSDNRLANNNWKGAAGLARDVAYYGQWMKEEAFRRIGHLYPKVKIPREQGGGEATVIAWIWARTVKCPNPACGCEMPLASSFVLSKKKGKEAVVEPEIDYKHKKIKYTVVHSSDSSVTSPKLSRGANFKCIACGEAAKPDYIKKQATSSGLGAAMIAVVAEGNNGRIYLSPGEEQIITVNVDKPENYPTGKIAADKRAFWTPLYGLDTFDKLFTPRQLTALTTFSDLVSEVQEKATADALAAGMADDDVSLEEGGTGARAYGQAVGVYLALVISKLADRGSTICSWDASREGLRNTFGRQAIPMVWDFAEGNPFCNSSGSFNNMLEWIYQCLENLPAFSNGEASQFDAQSDCGLRNIMISTDPPYYDNIGYADLSDFFYVWLRRSLKDTYPELFKTMLVPKTEELIATPYRHDGSTQKAKEFFEDGMLATCQRLCQYTREDIPITIYYAYKQSDSDERDGIASSGWETMLSAIIQAGFSITGTWPMRTEMANRSIASGTNALASSIVLVCRKRSKNATACTRRDLMSALHRELRPALETLQRSNIAPVDLAQSAIGPGISVFSRYRQVLEADGTPMSVRTALQIINQELDTYFSGQDSGMDNDSRFCMELFTQYAYNIVKFGDADNLARAKGTSVGRLKKQGVLYAAKGEVCLLERPELPPPPRKGDKQERSIWLLTQQLTYTLETDGIQKCAETLASASGTDGEEARNLAYRLYSVCERKSWTKEAFAYNALVVAWPDVQSRATEIRSFTPEQFIMDEY